MKTDILPDGAKSRLFIANANAQDSGNYTCALADVASTTVAIHVLNGKYVYSYITRYLDLNLNLNMEIIVL